jgi:hypothetical protein
VKAGVVPRALDGSEGEVFSTADVQFDVLVSLLEPTSQIASRARRRVDASYRYVVAGEGLWTGSVSPCWRGTSTWS